MAPDPSLLAGSDPYDHMDREAERLDAFFTSLGEDGWSRPTACADWDVRDLLGHLAASEAYNAACLADDVPAFLAGMGERGVTDLDAMNAVGVSDYAGRPAAEVLGEWRRRNAETRAQMRARRGDYIATAVGPYPMDWQAWHLANELAIHADDVGAPVTPEEAPARLAWLAAFARFALTETDKGVTAEPVDGSFKLSYRGVEAIVTPAELVAAVNARALPTGRVLDEPLRSALPMM